MRNCGIFIWLFLPRDVLVQPAVREQCPAVEGGVIWTSVWLKDWRFWVIFVWIYKNPFSWVKRPSLLHFEAKISDVCFDFRKAFILERALNCSICEKRICKIFDYLDMGRWTVVLRPLTSLRRVWKSSCLGFWRFCWSEFYVIFFYGYRALFRDLNEIDALFHLLPFIWLSFICTASERVQAQVFPRPLYLPSRRWNLYWLLAFNMYWLLF